ncbi:hypothetical protein PoB_007265800 [Plakobranchus ocellatus]|uniref:Uncharacterized protein n=1 Tax=Plakobranchus ocellatus TaxID=259542 RepID=A0AAV4DPC0_9GAST|nr:hypothetical protein PoB_007265800 [Plakobranchus ocellatus]
MFSTVEEWSGILCTASPQQGDLRLSGPLSGQGAGGGARTRVPADLRAGTLSTVPPTAPHQWLPNIFSKISSSDTTQFIKLSMASERIVFLSPSLFHV